MSSSDGTTGDPLEFLKRMWGSMGFGLPGIITPTLDVDELDKRITDLRAVEGWLKMNLNMLQMTIQGLEVQRATLAAMRAMSQPGEDNGENPSAANPFSNPALWNWPFGALNTAAQENEAEPPAEPTTPKAPRKSGRKA